MGFSRLLGGVGIAVLVAACSAEPPSTRSHEPANPLPRVPPPPAQAPTLPETGERDADGDRLDDAFNEKLLHAGSDARALGQSIPLEVILVTPVEQADLDYFAREGGKIRYVFRELSYGFTGALPLDKLRAVSARYGERLHLIAAPSQVVPFMDEATRTGRVRAIWASNFAGSASGYSGNSNITVAVLDTGVDSAHTDLSGRMQGFQDYTSDAAASARDVNGHGTHVAGIAVGSGAAFGSATAALKYTQSGNLSGVASNQFTSATVHTPAYLGGTSTLTLSATATFSGGVSSSLHALRTTDPAGSYTSFASASGTSPLSFSNQSGGTSGMVCQGALVQSNPAGVTNFAVSTTIANYPGVGDGFNALRGVAPTCRYFGAKVFTDTGSGNSLDIAEALDNIVSRRVADNIKIANLSLGVSGSGTDTTLRTKVNDTVSQGIVVVVAAGNDGPSTTIGDPGRASKVITVGAANDVNQLTSYTSAGFGSPGSTEDTKPDLLAPGGSSSRSMILAPDTNTADGNSSGFADVVANDYASLQGTSMATPFVSGAVALMIDALQKSGTTWSFSGSTQPLLLKMLLLASATESNAAREVATNSPSLGRTATPKDLYEGYGIANPDAAIEALVQTFSSPLAGSVSSTSPARLEWERRAWGRKLSLVNGSTVSLSLTVPSTADYDLYLYSSTPDAKGNPVRLAASVNAATDSDETIAFTSSATETAYLFVKRISGHGSFSLSGSVVSHCGDGDVDTGEQCDPAAVGSSTCCSSTCTTVSNGTSCSDGSLCTQTDTCQAGVCTGTSPVVCTASDQCHDVGTCNPSTGLCTNPSKNDGSSCNDGNACTQSDTCQSGSCTGSNPVVCTASDQCHVAGSCDTATGKCTNPAKSDGVSCSDGNSCTQSDTCQSGVCTGSNPVVCTALDQCHEAGSCDAATGKCSNPLKNDGATCDDGNKCTSSDTCQNGTCTAGSPVVCAASDQCHDAGSCDSATGKCTSPAKNDGAACNDGNACTQSDTCQSGSCTGSNPVVCAASDQCHDAGSCDSATGKCSNPAKSDGAACDDGSKCTRADSCQGGACVGESPVLCVAVDQCHEAGSCDAATGLCSSPIKPNGAACNDGDPCTQSDTCQLGACAGNDPVVCAAADQCHDAGVCDSATGACTNPAKPDGSACTDGNLCTKTDSCVAGACVGASPVSCVAADQCHEAGACDPATGLCSDPAVADGTPCTDVNGCTLGDACEAGLCLPAAVVTCPAPSECQQPGACETVSGSCQYLDQPDGTPCGANGSCEQGACIEAPPHGEGGAGGEGGAAEGGAGNGGVGGAPVGGGAGAATGGMATGGMPSGGMATGGAGGFGGKPMGGAGGMPSGGMAAGGAGGFGGKPMGGAGGTPSGGMATGGTPSGGTATSGTAGFGGTPSGGAGGTPSGGMASGGAGGTPSGGVTSAGGTPVVGAAGEADGADAGKGGSHAGGETTPDAGEASTGTGSGPRLPDIAPPRDSGCGCVAAGSEPAPGALLLTLGVLAGALRRRRRPA